MFLLNTFFYQLENAADLVCTSGTYDYFCQVSNLHYLHTLTSFSSDHSIQVMLVILSCKLS